MSFWTEKKYIHLSAICIHKYFWGCVFNFRWQSYIVVLHVVQPFSAAKQMLEDLLRMRLRQCYPIFLQGMMGRQHTNLAGNWFCIQSCTLRESSVRQITFWTDLPLVCFCNDMHLYYDSRKYSLPLVDISTLEILLYRIINYFVLKKVVIF